MNTKDRNEVKELLNAVQGSAVRALRYAKSDDWHRAAQAADDAAGWAAEANAILLAEYHAQTGEAPYHEHMRELESLAAPQLNTFQP